MSPARLLALTAILCAAPAAAFDYLEHSFFSDRACLEAQRRLAPLAATDEAAARRYLSLSLFCPERWDRPYCSDGFKQLEGNINRLSEPPAESGDHPVTLGDLAALPDHLTDYGPVRNLPHAQRDGLTRSVVMWLGRVGDAAGVVSDVAEDACEVGDRVDFPAAERDLTAVAFPPGPTKLSPFARGQILRGPVDPSGAYSFDNPQFLDLVLRNESHFGLAAQNNWLGFHTAAKDLASQRCEDVLALDDGDLEELAWGLPAFEETAWSSLQGEALRVEGCKVVAERIRLRLLEWRRRASPELVSPVALLLTRLETGDPALAGSLVPLVLSVVFEGGGIHFLQDAFSGGHLRIDRASLNLEEARYQHDEDSRHGVAASVRTADRSEPLIAFGDGYLLGRPGAPAEGCDEATVGPDVNAACLLAHQRRWVLAASTASLLDWASPDESRAGEPCTRAPAVARYVCEHLPAETPAAAGLHGEDPRAARGTLPVPPPPFSYQSILVSSSLDLAGGAPQLGVRTVFLNGLGSRANWMTSWNLGILTTLGAPERQQLHAELSYMFHWRWAARFLINAGPFAYLGARGLGFAPEPVIGAGPNVGLSILPEGWIRMPLEITFSYRMPLTLIDGRAGTHVRVEAHWLEFSLGLAFL